MGKTNVAVAGEAITVGVPKPSWKSEFCSSGTNVDKFNIVVDRKFTGKEEQVYLQVNAGKGNEKLVISQYEVEQAYNKSGSKMGLTVESEGQDFINPLINWTITKGVLSVYKG